MRIAYLTGEYPRVTDTFIQREVAALRELGEADQSTVQTFSVRSPKASGSLSSAQQKERDRTTYLLPPNALKLLMAHSTLLVGNPKRYLQALVLAWKTRQLGIRGSLYQLIYFLEAGLLAKQMQNQGIEHLHNHFGDSSCTVAMLASALSDIGYSFTLHGPGIFFEPHRWRLDEKIHRARFVSCISNFCRSQTMVFAPWDDWQKLHIVHCGIDPKQFTPESSTTKALAPEQTSQDAREAAGPRLLFVGRLAAAKGLPILLEGLADLKRMYPTVQLTVVGDGTDRQALESQTTKLGLTEHVTFVGYQSPESVRRYLQGSDVFVMSSFAEGVPVVLMEALMAGVPVVATQIAGVSELVEEGVNGFLVPPSDPLTLSARLQTLLADAELRQRFGEQGKLKVSQSFNINREAEKLYRLISTAISKGSAVTGSAVTSASMAVNPAVNPAVNSTVVQSLAGLVDEGESLQKASSTNPRVECS